MLAQRGIWATIRYPSVTVANPAVGKFEALGLQAGVKCWRLRARTGSPIAMPGSCIRSRYCPPT